MFSTFIKNDLKKSKLITAAIAAFILTAALLVSLATLLTINLFGATDTLLASAKTPHFMRMHSGEVDSAQIEQFAKSQPNVEEWQVLEYLNIEGAQIVIGGETLSWSTQDNGFSTQSKSFDYLLDLGGKVITPKDGEVYLPLYYMKQGSAKIGDIVSVNGVELTVAGFLRDSMMNPAMANSKRFLVSEHDFEQLRDSGIMEYLIEFRLFDESATASLESAYLAENLPANGPQAITYPLVKMMNGIEDGMMIAVLALISILVIIVALLCIRFTLLAKIEEDYREIGVLKALGMRASGIRRLYGAKYGAIAAAASLLGFLIALALQEPFLANIRLYLGTSDSQAFGMLAALLGAALIFLIVTLSVFWMLRRFKKIPAAQAVRFGAPQEKSKRARVLKLTSGVFSVNAFLAIKDVLARKKLYVTMFLVIVISAFILIVPQNIASSIASPNFMTNMGVGKTDFSLYVSNAQTDDVEGLAAQMDRQLAQDKSIAQSALLTTMLFEMPQQNGAVERIQVTLGNHDAFPISYIQGASPKTESDIALSSFYADSFGVGVGEDITLLVDGKEKQLTVCGIYSDITNAGKTAKALFDVKEGEVLSASVLATLNNPAEAAAKVEQYRSEFPDARVLELSEISSQMLGGIISSIEQTSFAAIFVAALLTVLVTLLFLKMLVTKDRYPIAVLKSFGFTTGNIRRQYLLRSAIVLVLGVAIGTILANTLGEYVGAALLSSFGASSFHLEINPFFAYLFAPLLLAASVYAGTLLGTRDVGKVKIFEHIKEA